jgi:hypothetical protein
VRGDFTEIFGCAFVRGVLLHGTLVIIEVEIIIIRSLIVAILSTTLAEKSEMRCKRILEGLFGWFIIWYFDVFEGTFHSTSQPILQILNSLVY